ncbi:Pvc16 family protein [Robbsia sp. KACC 23696]|uniref:Pvc16 family protein n=1 Tax=Robbsia sp. KACC 23696 TaxID=3149231 RepID=UPI00325B36A8
MTINVEGQALSTVTKAVENIIKEGLGDAKIVCEQESCVTFRVPRKTDKQKVSVFLYDVHEDLDVRIGAAREVEDRTGAWKPLRMFLRFSYLITCWRKDQEGEPETADLSMARSAAAESPAFRLPQVVLDAMLRNRTLKDVPGAFCRVLPPSENLDALGQFWQALKGNNPRLCMSYAVTVPVEVPVPAKAEPVWTIVDSKGTVDQPPSLDAWESARRRPKSTG